MSEVQTQTQQPQQTRSEIFPSLPPDGQSQTNGTASTALVGWKPEAVASVKLTGEIVRLAAAGIGGNLRRARQDAANRLYRDPARPEVPRLFRLEFTNGARNSGEEPVPRAVTKLKLRGEFVDVTVAMLHDIELEFDILKKDRRSGDWTSNGSYICALLCPAKGDMATGLWKAVPVGLASASVLDPYNVVQKGRNQPVVEALKHRLDNFGTLRVKYRPTHWNTPQRKGDRTLIGFRKGRSVLLSDKSPMPRYRHPKGTPEEIARDADGALAFSEGTFRVEVYETCYVFTYLGPAEHFEIEERVPPMYMKDRLDPYRCWGQTRRQIDPDAIADRQRMLLSTVNLPENPFRRYVQEVGIVLPSDDTAVIRGIAEELLPDVAREIAEDMAEEWRILTTAFMTYPASLSMSDILGGLEDTRENRKKIWNRRKDPKEGKDFLAGFIESVACKDEGETFDWGSPIQRKLRQKIFHDVCRIVGDPPTAPDQAPAAASAEEAGAPTAQTGAPEGA